MKKILTLAALVAATSLSFAQGTVNFANSAATLISAGGVATPAVAGQFIYAVFVADPATVGAAGTTVPITDGAFQVAGGYNTNSAILGRMTTRNNLVVGGTAGSSADFIVRGWSVNAGTTWAAALAFWNNGNPSETMYLGQSTVGNNILLGNGGAISSTTLFGVGATQVSAFNMLQYNPVPEPTSMALAGLGAASLLIFRRRK